MYVSPSQKTVLASTSTGPEDVMLIAELLSLRSSDDEDSQIRPWQYSVARAAGVSPPHVLSDKILVPLAMRRNTPVQAARF